MDTSRQCGSISVNLWIATPKGARDDKVGVFIIKEMK